MSRADLLLVLVILSALQVASFAAFFHSSKRPDFLDYYTAAELVRQGDSIHLYDLSLQQATQDRIAGASGTFLPFYYPAFLVPLFLALPEDYELARIAWALVSLLLLLMFAWTPLRETPDRKVRILLATAFPPVLFCVLLGQVAILLLLIFAGSLCLWQSGKARRAGLVLGLALIKFQHLLPFLLVLAVRKQWRVLSGVAATALALLGVFVAVTGVQGLADYAAVILHLARHTPEENAAIGLSLQGMASIRGFLSLWMEGVPLLAATALLSIAAMVFAALNWSEKSLPRSYALGMTASFILSFHANIADMTLLLLPVLVLASRLDSASLVVLVILYFPLSYLVPLHFGLTALLFPAVLLCLFALRSTSGNVASSKPNSLETS